MRSTDRMRIVAALSLAALLGACSTSDGEQEGGAPAPQTSRAEHALDAGEHAAEGREEAGTQLARSERYEAVRNGARLILAYDEASDSFRGLVENATERTLRRVRVEVHLSTGKELGPTEPVDLAPGHERAIVLHAEGVEFETWSAHPEVGGGEHGHEGGEEHGNEHE